MEEVVGLRPPSEACWSRSQPGLCRRGAGAARAERWRASPSPALGTFPHGEAAGTPRALESASVSAGAGWELVGGRARPQTGLPLAASRCGAPPHHGNENWGVTDTVPLHPGCRRGVAIGTAEPWSGTPPGEAGLPQSLSQRDASAARWVYVPVAPGSAGSQSRRCRAVLNAPSSAAHVLYVRLGVLTHSGNTFIFKICFMLPPPWERADTFATSSAISAQSFSFFFAFMEEESAAQHRPRALC